MAHWEFLIQEEGSRVWKQIATPARLTPGRYRLVVRSTYPEREMEVRVTHRLETDPPKQRSVARSRQTTPQGLMVVVPFTTFKPGHWDISCTPIAETETEAAQYHLALTVSPVATTPEAEANPTTVNEASQTPAVEQSPEPVSAIMSEVAAWEDEATGNSAWENADAITQAVNELEQLLKQELDPLLEEAEEFLVSEEEAEITPSPTPPAADFHLQLDLETDAFVATHGETIALTGTIQAQEPLPENCTNSQLRYQLWHPQNQDLILEVSQPIPQLSIPLSFHRSLIVPRQQGTCLLLGEVVLTAEVDHADVTLASQPFTITLNVSDILDNILTTNTEREAKITQEMAATETPPESAPATEKPKPVSLDLPSLNTAKTVANPPTQTLQTAVKNIIPPQINQPVAKGRKSLKLPNLPAPPQVTPTPPATPNLPAGEEQAEAAALTDNQENQTSAVPVNSSREPAIAAETATLPEDLAIPETVPEINDLAAESLGERDTDLTNEAETTTTPPGTLANEDVETPDTSNLETEAAPLTETSPKVLTPSPENDPSEAVAEQFQSLKLQKRFWDRLSDLATDEEAAQWLQEQEVAETTAADSSLAEDTEEETPPVSPVEAADAGEDRATVAMAESEAETADLTDSAEAVEILDWEETPAESEFEDLDESLAEIAASDALIDEATRLATLEEGSEETETEEVPAEADVIEADLAVEATVDTEEEVSNSAEAAPSPEVQPEPMLATAAETDRALDPVTEVEVVPDDTEESDPRELEIVLDDEEVVAPPPVIQRDTSGMPYPQGIMPPRRESPLTTRSLEPVPKPMLLVPEGDLTAGEAVILGVRVPPYEGSVYVKLWIQDRQHRTILDGPRTFVDFEFHADGERETLTQVTVPYGSMEIQLDAIAINPQTQQESHKATVERTVVPADLPSLSLQEFEL